MADGKSELNLSETDHADDFSRNTIVNKYFLDESFSESNVVVVKQWFGRKAPVQRE